MDDAFDAACEIPVAGGALTVAAAGRPMAEAEGVVVALHGITASHLAWASVARELTATTAACLLAPDLRGRGGSAQLPGPYGIDAHVADLLAVLDFLRVGPVVLAGHSMGAYVAARFAAEHPERVSGLVLVDGGLPLPFPDDHDPDEALHTVLGPALTRLGVTYARRTDYLEMWRMHPAFAGPWDDDVEAYLTYELTDAGDEVRPDAVRSVTSESAVRTDGRELLLDEATRNALAGVQAPVRLLRAHRGMLDDDPLLSSAVIEELSAARPEVQIDEVEDVNHYSILLGPGPGAGRVTSAIRCALGDA
ncbi:MAG TPA: alpha/beta fold hydrolase [Baekduia sp.]|uniref:alpha/beta hydrolase n=1 Tax=Baekduia sp. TaxID=2600305 RepID=UPI002B88E344|nr:alpha/beta fold hydrolase [Baekduia sp.]HMJ34267.1 alpha/beta fold hydrolase [Baekduia sp.]